MYFRDTPKNLLSGKLVELAAGKVCEVGIKVPGASLSSVATGCALVGPGPGVNSQLDTMVLTDTGPAGPTDI
jgi:hypothetical protein